MEEMGIEEYASMNDLILAKMSEGDWGEVVRLMHIFQRSANALSRPCRTVARMHDKIASFVKRNGLRLLQDDARVWAIRLNL